MASLPIPPRPMKRPLLCLILCCLCASVLAAGRGAPDAGPWLDDHGPLAVGVVLQAPYVQREHRRSELAGVSVELMQLLAAQLGATLEWRAYPDRAALDEAARRGEVDLAPGLLQTPAGLRDWLFSDPYLRVPHLLVGERDRETAVDIDGLAAGTVLAVRAGSSAELYLRDNYPTLTLLPVGSERHTLQAVLEGRARFGVIDEAQLGRLSREPDFDGLAIVGDLGHPLLLRIAVRRDLAPLAAAVHQGLRRIPDSALEQLHERWLQPQTVRVSGLPNLWKNLALLMLLALLACGAALHALRRQRRLLEKALLDTRQAMQERQAMEEALRLAQFSIDQSRVGILWVNWDSYVRYANHSAELMLGCAPGTLVERALAEFHPALEMDRWLELWKTARQEEAPVAFETQVRRQDGRWLPVDVSLSFLRSEGSEYLVVFLTDDTERRRARAALEESEARLKGIASNVPGLVFRLERMPGEAEAEFAFISEGSEALVGYASRELIDPAVGIRSLVHPDDRPGYLASQQAAFDGEHDWHWQGRILTRDGQLRWADIKAGARRLDNGGAVWDGVVWDITPNTLIELELADSRARLRELAAHLDSVREEERARIAREVHDELGQVLTVLKFEISLCEVGYAALDPGLDERLQAMKRLLVQLFQLVRDVASALRPPILDAGLVSAIEWQVRRFEARTGLTCLVEAPEHLAGLSDARALGLFRVLQEALTNIMRHADAHSVEVRLAQHGDRLSLSVGDDGRGFDPEQAARQRSFGLVGMRERVLMMGGELSIHSQPGEGTTLEVSLALDTGEAAA